MRTTIGSTVANCETRASGQEPEASATIDVAPVAHASAGRGPPLTDWMKSGTNAADCTPSPQGGGHGLLGSTRRRLFRSFASPIFLRLPARLVVAGTVSGRRRAGWAVALAAVSLVDSPVRTSALSLHVVLLVRAGRGPLRPDPARDAHPR